MDRDKMFEPAFQKSFTEAILKENKIRVKWHLDHGDNFRKGAKSFKWDDEPDDDDEDFVAQGDGLLPQAPPERSDVKDLKDAVRSLLERVTEQKKVGPPPVMKPVDVKIKRILYKGLSHHEEGRYNYLKTRYKDDPEDKFVFPICSSWEYGWTYGQDHDLKCPDHGRRQIMKTSFFRPNDPQLKPRD